MIDLPGNFPYTKIPNIIIDRKMAELNSSDFKVLIMICRKTLGFHKEKDNISLSQMTKLTGLSKNTVIKAIERLEKENLIIKQTDTLPYQYSINREKLGESHSADLEPQPVYNLNCSKVQKMNTQKKTLKKRERNTTTVTNHEISEDVTKIIDIWNSLFDIKISNSNREMIEAIENNLKQFSVDELKTALYNRSGAKYYKRKDHGLKHHSKCFFPHQTTIRADLKRIPDDLFTYEEMFDRVANGLNKESDFEIQRNITDKKGNPMRKLIN